MADVGIKISAQDDTKAAFSSIESSLKTMQSSATSVSGVLASMGVGISLGALAAMTKQIIDGLDAMNDLKDASGASIENISALEDVAARTGASFETVSTALVKLNKSLSAAKPGSDTEAAIKAIGLSVKELKDIDPVLAFQKISVALSGFSDDANKARLVQELFGKSTKELAPLLKDLADAGSLVATVTTDQAEAAEKLANQLSSMEKNTLDLKRSLVNELIPSLSKLAAEMLAAKKTSLGFFDGFIVQGLQNPFKSITENANKYRAEIASLEKDRERFLKGGNDTSSIDAAIATMKRRLEYYKEVQLQTMDFQKGDQSSAEARRLGLVKTTVGEFSKPDKPKRDTANEFAGDQEAMKEWVKALQESEQVVSKATAKIDGLSESERKLRDYQNSAAYALTEKLVPGINDQVVANLELGISLEKLEKSNVAAAESRNKFIDSLSKGLASMQQENQKIAEYNERLGLSKEAVAELDAIKLESQATTLDLMAIKEMDKNLDQEQYDIYKKQADTLRERAGLLRTGASKEAELEPTRKINEEWKRGWEATDQLAREVFADWATDGGNAAKKIGDTLKKALLSAIYEATLKPLVFQVYSSIVGGTASTAAQALSSGGNGASGLANLFGSAGSLFGSGFKAGISSVFGESGIMGGWSAGTTALRAGNMAGGLGTLAGVAAPFLAGVAGLTALANAMQYTVTPAGNGLTATLGARGLTTGQVGTYSQFTQTGGLGGGGTTTNRAWGVADAGTTGYIDASAKAITAANRAYGDALGLSSTALDAYTASIEVNTAGMDAAAAKAAIDAALTKFSADQASAAYSDAVSAFAKDGETVAQTIARLGTDLTVYNQWATVFGTTLQDISVTGAAAADTLITAFGGLEKFNASLSTYYNTFYSETERRNKMLAGAQADLASMGIDVTMADLQNATKEQIRAWIELQYAMNQGAHTAEEWARILGWANSIGAGAGSSGDASQSQQATLDAEALHKWAVEHPWESLFGSSPDGKGGINYGPDYVQGQSGGAAGASTGSAADEAGWKAGIRSWLDKLNSTDAGVEGVMRQRETAWAAYKTQLSLAQGGDANARANITGFADTLIGALKNSSKTMLEEQLGIARIKEQVGGLTGDKKPEVMITDAITQSGDGIVTAIRGLGDLLSGDASNPGGLGSGMAPNASGRQKADAQANAQMQDALTKMAKRLEAIETNTRIGAMSSTATKTILDEVTNGARAMQTITG